MKKTIFFGTAILTIMLLWSCGGKDDSLSKPTVVPSIEILSGNDALEFLSEQSTQKINFRSNVDWEATLSPEAAVWCDVTPTKGKAGTHELTITASENNGSDERSGTLKISGTNVQKTISIKQHSSTPILEIEMEGQRLDYTADGGEKTININSNKEWKATLDQEAEKWCRISKETGIGSSPVKITVEQNRTINERSATLTVKSDTMVRTVSIVQIGEAPYLTVDKENISIGRESSEGEIVISTNCEWEITMLNECDWFTIPTQYGKPGEHSIIYSAGENALYEERTTSFTIKTANIEKVVTVTQAAAELFEISQKEMMQVGKEGGVFTISVTTNTEYKVECPDSWVKPTKLSENKVELSVEPNPDYNERSTNVVFSTATKSISLFITQNANSKNDYSGGIDDLIEKEW